MALQVLKHKVKFVLDTPKLQQIINNLVKPNR